MSEKEILQDIVAYCPAVAGVTGAMPAKEVNRLIGKNQFLIIYRTVDDLLVY